MCDNCIYMFMCDNCIYMCVCVISEYICVCVISEYLYVYIELFQSWFGFKNIGTDTMVEDIIGNVLSVLGEICLLVFMYIIHMYIHK